MPSPATARLCTLLLAFSATAQLGACIRSGFEAPPSDLDSGIRADAADIDSTAPDASTSDTPFSDRAPRDQAFSADTLADGGTSNDGGGLDGADLDGSDPIDGPAAGDAAEVDSARPDAGGRDIGDFQEVPIKLTAGYDHSCALYSSGRIKCWGYNWSGQLGYGHRRNLGDEPGEMEVLPFVPLGAGVRAVDIGAGQSHTCALLDDDSIKCWGEASSGNLGNEDYEPRGDDPFETEGPFVDLIQPSGLTPLQMSVQKRNVCVVYDDGSLRCNGQNDFGQLGLGTTSSIGNDLGEMGDGLPTVDLGSGRSSRFVVEGDYHACAISDQDQVKCWGRNHYGRLGLGHADHLGWAAGQMGDDLPFVDVGAGRSVIALYRSYFGNCVKLDDGSFKCWGANIRGEMALGDTNNRGDNAGEMGDALPVVDPGPGRGIAAIRGGYHTICLLLDSAELLCAGQNNAGQLGLGHSDNYGDEPGETWAALNPIDFGAGRSLRNTSLDSIAIGNGHACALLDDDSIKCWGDNSAGQLGLGDNMPRGDDPNEMGDDLPALPESGDPPLPPYPVDAIAPGPYTVAQLAAGVDHSCARFFGGAVKCWGDNDLGQLGSESLRFYGNEAGEMGEDLPLVDLGAGRTAVDIAAGWYFTCALLDDDSLKCWGANLNGVLGQGDGVWRGSFPGEMGDGLPSVLLPSGLVPVDLKAGPQHACVLFDDASLRCWGHSYYGSSGALPSSNHRGDEPGEMGDNLGAVDLGAGAQVLDFALGDRFTCAVLSTGAVKCFGIGGSGRLGQGSASDTGRDPLSFGDALPAVDLGANESAVRIFAGSAHACAQLSAGGFKCWGDNSEGQLGLGDTVNRGDGVGAMGDALPVQLRNLGPGLRVLGLGSAHTCALLDDATVACVGRNQEGQLGLGDARRFGDEAGETWASARGVNFGALALALQLAVGYRHNCVLLADSRVKCWGQGSHGALGHGRRDNIGDATSELGDLWQAVELY